MGRKKCPTCRTSTCSSNFGPNPARYDGLSSHCRKCMKKNYKKYRKKILENKQQYYKLNKIEIDKKKKVYYEKNREEIRNCPKKKKRKKKLDRQSRLKNEYNLSMKQFRQMYIEQNGNCAICGVGIRGSKVHIDHCHSTGKVRGLLCRNCNLGLGFFKDKKKSLNKAITYLAGSERGNKK